MTRDQKLRNELERVLHILIDSYGAEKVILFGSMARKDTHEANDIDLVVIKETDKKFIDRIGEAIDLCRPHVAMDFIVYTPKEFQEMRSAEKFVKEEVVEKGKVLYDAAA